MKQNAPDHIIKYCYKDINDIFFRELCEQYGSECSYVHKLRCSCGGSKFLVYQDDHPSIFVKCIDCNKMITVYDLDYYPAATKLKQEFEMKRINDKGQSVYVNYEYSDEYLYEEDVDFDSNDITWGRVFIMIDGQLLKVLDDETA